MYGTINKLIYFFTIFTIISLFPAVTVNGANKCKITGIIVDNENKTRAGVKIIVYRADKVEGRSESKSDGSYEVEFDVGEPIDETLYERSGWYADSIYNLSGQKDHVINKVIYKWGTKLSKSQIQGYIGAVNKLYNISAAKGVPQKKFIAEVVSPFPGVPISAWAKMPIPVFEAGIAIAKKYPGENLYDFIVSDGSFTIWEKLAEAAKISYKLKGKHPYTLILPIDSAFSALSPKFLLKAKASTGMAQDIVFPQIIPGKYIYREISNMRSVKTLSGYREIDICLLNPIATDIQIKNGLIHVVGSLYPEIEQRWRWHK